MASAVDGLKAEHFCVFLGCEERSVSLACGSTFKIVWLLTMMKGALNCFSERVGVESVGRKKAQPGMFDLGGR